MNSTRNPPDTDVEKLSRLKGLSWLNTSELKLLAKILDLGNFKRPEVISRQTSPTSEVYILLTGIARITCMNARAERVTIALMAPGPIPDFPVLPLTGFDFRCEAYKDCRVGGLSWKDFDSITAHGSESAFRNFHENDLKRWHRLFLRGSGFLNFDLHQRVALTLLELCSEFGVEESRGTLLSESFSHKDIAELVGASRPRVTEHLAKLEHDEFVVRQGRQLIVRVEKLSELIAVRGAS